MNCVYENISTKPLTLYNQCLLKETLKRTSHQTNDYKNNLVGMFINAFKHCIIFCLAVTKKVLTSKLARLNKNALESDE